MQAKQERGGTSSFPKARKSEKSQAKPVQQRLASVRDAIKNQSSATRANLTGRLKVG